VNIINYNVNCAYILYDYRGKGSKGDIYFGPYAVTVMGGWFDYKYGYDVEKFMLRKIDDHYQFMERTLHFFSVEHVDELIKILKERTSAVKYQRK